MGTTPRAQIPYPELTDTPDVPRDVKALAEKVDTDFVMKAGDDMTGPLDFQSIDGVFMKARAWVVYAESTGERFWIASGGSQSNQEFYIGPRAGSSSLKAIYLRAANVLFNGPALTITTLSGAPGSYSYTYLYRRTTDGRIFNGAAIGSSRASKEDIKPASLPPVESCPLTPVSFRYKNMPDEPEHVGLIADDAVGTPFEVFVQKDPDGEVMDFDYPRFTAYLLQEVKRLSERVAALESA